MLTSALVMLESLFAPSCVACGRRTQGHDHPFCPECALMVQTVPPWHGRSVEVDGAEIPVVALFEYAGPVRQAIVRGKYGGESWRLRRLGRLLGPVASAVDAVAAVPVPSTTTSLIERGTWPAWEVALGIRDVTGLRVVPCLERKGGRKAQAALGRKERMTLSPQHFSVKGEVPDRYVLVDDVVTTGSTIRAAAGRLAAERRALPVAVLVVAAS